MRRSLGTALTALVMALLVGCGSSGGSDSGDAGGGAGEGVSAPDPDAPGGPASPDEADPDRQVVTTAIANVAVEDPLEAAQQVSELVESVGGRVDQRTEQAGSEEDGLGGAGAELVVRVPADELTGVLADLKDIGDVESRSVSRSDVTASVVDLDARISALRTSVARLQTLMDDAETTATLLEAERALSERQADLESLQSQRALLADQVELSTLSVNLHPFGVAPAGGPDGFLEGVATGWRALVSALGAAVVVVGVVLPWAAVALLVAVAVLVPLRLARRRAAVATAAPPQE